MEAMGRRGLVGIIGDGLGFLSPRVIGNES